MVNSQKEDRQPAEGGSFLTPPGLLAVGIFAKDWIFYLLTACLVFVISMLGSRKNKRK